MIFCKSAQLLDSRWLSVCNRGQLGRKRYLRPWNWRLLCLEARQLPQFCGATRIVQSSRTVDVVLGDPMIKGIRYFVHVFHSALFWA